MARGASAPLPCVLLGGRRTEARLARCGFACRGAGSTVDGAVCARGWQATVLVSVLPRCQGCHNGLGFDPGVMGTLPPVLKEQRDGLVALP